MNKSFLEIDLNKNIETRLNDDLNLIEKLKHFFKKENGENNLETEYFKEKMDVTSNFENLFYDGKIFL